MRWWPLQAGVLICVFIVWVWPIHGNEAAGQTMTWVGMRVLPGPQCYLSGPPGKSVKWRQWWAVNSWAYKNIACNPNYEGINISVIDDRETNPNLLRGINARKQSHMLYPYPGPVRRNKFVPLECDYIAGQPRLPTCRVGEGDCECRYYSGRKCGYFVLDRMHATPKGGEEINPAIGGAIVIAAIGIIFLNWCLVFSA